MSKIWYISKYASTPLSVNNSPTRQYGFSCAFAREGHDVSLIYSRSNGNPRKGEQNNYFIEDEIDSIKVVQIKGNDIKLGFSISRIISWILFEIRLRRYIKQVKEKPEVAIVSSLSLITILNGLYLKKKYGTKFILEIRDIWPKTLVDVAGLSKSNPFVFILSWIEKKGYVNSDKIIGTMPNLREHVEEVIGSTDKVNFIPMGYDPNFYKDLEEVSSEIKQDLKEKEFVVGYAGSIGKANAVHEITKASELLSQNSKIHFAILGEGPEKGKLIELTKNQNNISFFDKIDKKMVNSFLKLCDLLVIPIPNRSIYRYGVSPNKWIDYLFSGKPVVVCYDGYQSIINEANCGEFIPSGDAKILVDTIMSYSEKAEQEILEIGNRGREYLESKMTFTNLAKQYLDIILN